MKNGYQFYEKCILIPKDIPEPQLKAFELFIMAKYVWECKDKIASSLPTLKKYNHNIESIFTEVITYLESKDNTDLELIRVPLSNLLSLYNWAVRLRVDLSSLHKEYTTNILPCQLPSEYVDGKSLWVLGNPETTPENWLGHGYYWQIGEGAKDTAGPQDYDCFEGSFYKCRNAKVLVADYELLKRDFPFLASKTDCEINKWLLDECAYLSEGQLKRIAPEGDVGKFLEIGEPVVDTTKKRFGIRQRGFGRAATFFVGSNFEIAEGKVKSSLISVKGCGTQKLATDFTVKENGLLSMVDAFKEFAYQKLIQRIADISGQSWGCVQSYGIIDIGIKVKKGVENPGTGYIGERFGLTVRQAHSRFVGDYDEPAFFSVVTNTNQNNPLIKSFKETLLKYGITSEQEPIGEILKQPVEVQLNNQDTEWNIQGDATLARMVDFSQYYALPSSKLPSFWKMSSVAFVKGIQAGWAWRHFIKDEKLCEEYLGVKYNTKELLTKNQEELKKELGTYVGDKKPKYSWSWFLEVDDSELNKWSFDAGYNYCAGAETREVLKKLESWLPKA